MSRSPAGHCPAKGLQEDGPTATARLKRSPQPRTASSAHTRPHPEDAQPVPHAALTRRRLSEPGTALETRKAADPTPLRDNSHTLRKRAVCSRSRSPPLPHGPSEDHVAGRGAGTELLTVAGAQFTAPASGCSCLAPLHFLPLPGLGPAPLRVPRSGPRPREQGHLPGAGKHP
ncbi:uncharacterized protein LOC144581490 [Callithrix jacchus]